MEVARTHKIILFDGVCNLCNRTVLAIIERDKEDVFRFASLQGKVGQKMAQERGIDTSGLENIILIEPGRAYYTKSTAALKIARDLGGVWSLAQVLEWIPEGLRNRIYDHVAKNRYSWYGRTESCAVPRPELKAKFLDQE